VGINDLAKATTLASVGLAPSTGAAAGRPWTSLPGAAWASGAAPRRWTAAGAASYPCTSLPGTAGAASYPWTSAVRTSRTSPALGEDGGRIAGGSLWRGGGGGSSRGDSIATERSQAVSVSSVGRRRPSSRCRAAAKANEHDPSPRIKGRRRRDVRLLGESAGGVGSIASTAGGSILAGVKKGRGKTITSSLKYMYFSCKSD
jgi:hypothetical protein